MKNVIVTFAAILAVAQANAFAVMNGGYCIGYACNTIAGCAPEVEQNNTQVVVQKLSVFAESHQENKSLQNFVSEVKNEASYKSQMQKLFAAVGVDAQDIQQVSAFMGAQDFSSYARVMQSQFDLTNAQAVELVTAFGTALKGELE